MKNCIITARVTKGERKKILYKADLMNVSISQFVRMALKKNEITIVPGMDEVVYQMLKVGNNINQIACILNTNGTYPEIRAINELTEEFGEIKEEIKKIGEKI